MEHVSFRQLGGFPVIVYNLQTILLQDIIFHDKIYYFSYKKSWYSTLYNFYVHFYIIFNFFKNILATYLLFYARYLN